METQSRPGSPQRHSKPPSPRSNLPPCCLLTFHLKAHASAALWAKLQALNYPVAMKEEHHFLSLRKIKLHTMK